jgi:small subunit ribosomal protein S19
MPQCRRRVFKNPISSIIMKLSENKELATDIIVPRTQIITRKMLGKSFLVYNGKSFNKVAAVRLRLGHKFGEFAFTRKTVVHTKKKKKKK